MIGIETDDDVVVKNADGSWLLEQDKHSIQPVGHPFGDRSRALWNTLAIWVDALQTAAVPDGTKFLLATNKDVPNCLARQISAAELPGHIDECITSLEKAAQSPSEAIADLARKVLEPKSRGALRCVILNCTLSDRSDAADGLGLRSQTVAQLQIASPYKVHADSILDELLGWLQRTALSSWEAGTPAWIYRDAFVDRLQAAIDVRRRQLTRERAAHLIPVPADKIGEQKTSRFVKQLHLITDDTAIVDTAIREFVRCNIEMNRLSVEGNLTEQDWLAFESTLQDRWQKIRSRLINTRKELPPAHIGFEIFTDTTEDYREKLAGTDTEQVYLTSGTYHRLAELIRLGWHPDFEELMKDGSSD